MSKFKFWIMGWVLVLAPVKALPPVACGFEDPPSKAASSGEKGGEASKSVEAVLKARLRALEEEDQKLAEAASKITSGEAITSSDLFKTWLPPAVYLVEIHEPFHNLELTEAAAEIAEGLLGNKEIEQEKLLALKRRIERGDDVHLFDLESTESMGAEGRLRELDGSDAELKGLRSRLEALLFEARFRNAANLKRDPAGGAPPVPDAQSGEPVVKEDQRSLNDGLPSSPETVPGKGIDASVKGIDPAPGITIDYLALGRSCFRAGRFRESLDVFEKMEAASHPSGAYALFMIGRCQESLGLLDKAREAYREVGLQFPESLWAKESVFADKILAWKLELGPIEGVPAEAAVLWGGSQGPKSDGGSK